MKHLLLILALLLTSTAYAEAVWDQSMQENEEYPLPDPQPSPWGEAISPELLKKVEALPKINELEVEQRLIDEPDWVQHIVYFDTLLLKPLRMAETIAQIRRIGETYAIERIVVIGHADKRPITGKALKYFKDNQELSEARAKAAVAALVKAGLTVPISFSGNASHDPADRGEGNRALANNRRAEIVVHYNRKKTLIPIPNPEPVPKGELLSTMACSGMYEPAPPPSPEPPKEEREGEVDEPNLRLALHFNTLRIDNTGPEFKFLHRVFTILSENKDLIEHVVVVGHTDSDQIIGKATQLYKDNYELSQARARMVADVIHDIDPNVKLTYDGRGPDEPVVSNSTPQGKAANRRTEVVVYFHKQVASERTRKEGAGADTINRSKETEGESAPVRITVDGAPVDRNQTNHVDFQRCTDVALEKARIQVRFSTMPVPKVLNVTPAAPHAEIGKPLKFRVYANYFDFIERAELRVLREDGRSSDEAYAALPFNADGVAEWTPVEGIPPRAKFIVRVYGKNQEFDETRPMPLAVFPAGHAPAVDKDESLAGWGENRIALSQIETTGGSLIVNGSGIQHGYRVKVLNRYLPVDREGRFVAQWILPGGKNYEVGISVLNDKDQGMQFRRDLHIGENDWFWVGIANVVLGSMTTKGPANLVTQDLDRYDRRIYADGRLALYLKGKIQGKYLLTMSADTRESPLFRMFDNFLDKDPRELFRRIEPDRFYPVYGDDSTLVEDAPTQGRFYVRLDVGPSHVMWGNFHTRLVDTDFAQIDRGLYGAKVHWELGRKSDKTAARTVVDGYAAQPGTIQAREQFRGTGGSLYWLRNPDISTGSERVRVEIRDRDSNIPLKVNYLKFGEDYTVNNIQGSILLKTALPSTADESVLVRAGGLSGNPVYLVVNYEYQPNFIRLDTLSTGGRVANWISDGVRVGVTASRENTQGAEQRLLAADLLLRKSESTFIRGEIAETKGPGFSENTSINGGYDFAAIPQDRTDEIKAYGLLVEGGLGLYEAEGQRGSVDAYARSRGRGFSSSLQLTQYETVQMGGTASLPVTKEFVLGGKFDKMREKGWLDRYNGEVNARGVIDSHYTYGVGVRNDWRQDDSGGVIPLGTGLELGTRTDGTAQVGYQDEGRYDGYLLGQRTITRTGGRLSNNRYGVGGHVVPTGSLKIGAEATDGDGGFGMRGDTEYKLDDTTQLYVGYLREADRTDSGIRGRSGLGALTSGIRSRYHDRLQVYYENKYLHGPQPSGVTHSFGVDYSPVHQWNFGVTFEAGKLTTPDLLTVQDRTAGSLSLGYGSKRLKASSVLEARKDTTVTTERTSFFLRNQGIAQISDDFRFLARFNLARSKSSQGEYFNGDFTEGVLGLALRPADHDRLNALLKYTYYDFLPSAGQVDRNGLTPEFRQRSQVLAVDAIYDLFPWLSVGARYAFALRELQQTRTGGPFFESNAHLVIGRLDLHLIRMWDAIVEARRLSVPQAGDSRGGFLVGIYRHLAKDNHLKVGVGYNFTDFSDDLTDVSYRAQGVFLNIVSGF